MGKPIMVNQDGFRYLIDPDDPNRKPSEVKTYKLSPEEIEARYGKPNVSPDKTETYKKFDSNTVKFIREKESEEKKMSAQKITKEQLAEECRKLGFNKKAYENIAKKYGFASAHSVACLVSKYKIKSIVEVDQVKKFDKDTYEVRIETPVSILGIHDSGKREDCGTGAVRDTQKGKGRFDLITPEGLFRLARWYELGAIKYADRNWEKGIPVTRCISSAMRHLVKYLAGFKDEDHLAAVAWNVFAIMHFEKYMPELDDRPEWTKAANQ